MLHTNTQSFSAYLTDTDGYSYHWNKQRKSFRKAGEINRITIVVEGNRKKNQIGKNNQIGKKCYVGPE